MARSKRVVHLAAARAARRLPAHPEPGAPPALAPDKDIQGLGGLHRRLEAFTAEEDRPISSLLGKSVLISVGFLDKIAEKLRCDDCGETGAVASIQQNQLSPGIDFKCIDCSVVFCSVPGASVTAVVGKQYDNDGKRMCLVHDSLMNGGGFTYLITPLRSSSPFS